MNKIYTCEKFDNEKLRFEKLLNFCNNLKKDNLIICTRSRYLPLLYSKLFNFNVKFSFYNSKYDYIYNEDDLNNFKQNTNNILLTDIINNNFITPNLKKILFYDIDFNTLKIIQLDFKNKIEFYLFLLNDNNNFLLNNIIDK